MNVNRIDPEIIMAQATNLLQNQQKVNLGKDELEVLWENAKLTGDSTLFENVSDEDGIAMFDILDNEGNTAETSYKLLLNWLKSNAGVDSSGNNANVPTPNPGTGNVPGSDTTPGTDDTTPPEETPDTEDVTESGNNTGTETPPETNNTPSTSNPQVERQYLQLRPGETKIVEIDGKSYSFENSSGTINNVFYYLENGKVNVEGSDLKVSSAQDADVADNVRFMGNRNTIDMGKGSDTIDVEGDMNMIYGSEGNDFVKMRGNQNTADLSTDNDIVWIDGNNNNAFGQGGADNFFAAGADNTFFGQDGIDTSYYDESKGIGHEFRVENKLTIDDDSVKNFDKWLNGTEDVGPPYNKLPEALNGHEVRAYDDNTYTDKYEVAPLYYTEYRDIAYRELDAFTTENKVTGEGQVLKYDENGIEQSAINISSDGSVSVKEYGAPKQEIPSDKVQYVDKDGKVVTNPGGLHKILEGLATGTLAVKDAAAESTPTTPPSDNTMPTRDELMNLTASYGKIIGTKQEAATDEYLAALNNNDMWDDVEATAKYNTVTTALSTKHSIVVNKGLPLITTATEKYSAATDTSSDYYSQMYELIMKAFEANRAYFLNDNEENSEELKAKTEEANKELEEYLEKK